MKRSCLPADVTERLRPHFPELDLGIIHVVIGLPWYVRWFAPIRAAAFTGSATTIYFHPAYYAPEHPRGFELLAHELCHCVQFRRYGWLGMISRYGALYIKGLLRHRSPVRAYMFHPLEMEACARSAGIAADARG